MRLVRYLRLSAADTLAGQEAACRRRAMMHDHRLVSVFTDEGATLALADRPGLLAVLAAVAAGKGDGILDARLDLLAAKLTMQEAVLAQCWKLGAPVFTADEGEVLEDDPGDPLRIAMRQIAGILADYQHAQALRTAS